MGEEPRCPPGFAQFEGLAPDGQSKAWFLVSRDSMLGHFRETRNRSKQLEGFLVPEVVMSPAGIWADLKSAGKTGWLCYVGRPAGRYAADLSIELPIHPNKVFAVYVREQRASEGQFIIDNWEWIPEHPAEKNLPEDHHSRYGKLLWKRD